jgi:hypothetical protein
VVNTIASDIFKTLSESWQIAMDGKNYNDAIVSGISAYLIFREQKNDQIALGALNLIYVAITMLLNSQSVDSQEQCSFCGRSGRDVRLGAGSSAFICFDCVELFGDILRPKKSP